MYIQGLDIAKNLNRLTETHDKIEQMQGEKKEMKLYVLMSAFYKYVVFKTNDYICEV